MNIPQTPIHALGPQDEAQLVPVPDSRINFAEDENALQYLREHILPLITIVRDDGANIRDEWRAILNMTQLKHDDNQSYHGMSDAYLPLYAKALETKVSNVNQGLFPSDDYLDVRSLNQHEAWEPAVNSPMGFSQSDVLKAWMQYQFEKQMRLRSSLKPFLRQLFNYGISVGKVWYEKPLKNRMVGRTTKLPLLDQVMMDFGNYNRGCEGARFATRSMFTWHMWPATVNNLAEATLVFEDIQVSKQYIEEVGKKQGWVNLEQAIWSPQPSNANSDLQLQMDAIRNSPSTAVDMQRMGDKGHFSYLTEAYFTMPVPKGLYRDGEEVGSHVPVRVLLAGPVPVLMQRNPFWFQHAPYVVQKLNETPDSFYGIGMGRIGKSLQYLANDFMNQTNDNATYGLNPIALLNPSLMAEPPDPLSPGVVWKTTDVNNAVKFDRPPIEGMQYGLQMLQWVSSELNDLLGTPPILQGNNSKGSAKTATGSQLLQSNVKGDIADQVVDLELNVMVQLMEMTHKLGQQYQDQEMQIATSGGVIAVRPGDLVGEFGFQWQASSQTQNQQMRTQQALQLLQTVLPMVPLLQQQGKTFNPMPLINRIGKEGMGFRDLAECFPPAPMQPGMPGAAPGGAPGGAPGPGDSNAGASAVAQAPGGGVGPQPGEGEAFGEVRDQADQMAAMAGGANNAQQ